MFLASLYAIFLGLACEGMKSRTFLASYGAAYGRA